MPGAGTIRSREGAARKSVAHGETEAVACAAHRAEAFPLHGGEPASRAVCNLERKPEACSGFAGRSTRPRCAFRLSEEIGVRGNRRFVDRLDGDYRARTARVHSDLSPADPGEDEPLEYLARGLADEWKSRSSRRGAIAGYRASDRSACQPHISGFTHRCSFVRWVETRECGSGISRGALGAHPARRSAIAWDWRGERREIHAKSCPKIHSWAAASSRVEQRRVGIARDRGPLSSRSGT